MSPIKNTYKSSLLVKLFSSNSMFQGIDLFSEDMTNEQAEKIANSKGYFWKTKTHEWVFKPITTTKTRGDTSENYGNSGTGQRAMLVRLMADIDHLRQKTDDITLALELAGYRVVSVSAPVKNRGEGTWYRLYITAERVNGHE